MGLKIIEGDRFVSQRRSHMGGGRIYAPDKTHTFDTLQEAKESLYDYIAEDTTRHFGVIWHYWNDFEVAAYYWDVEKQAWNK